MEDEEEVRFEVDAVQAVYGDDFCVIDDFPPHLTVHIVPRTAEDSSQQFVEAIIGIRTSAQYPKEPAQVYLIESKGLDVSRQKYLINQMRQKAIELAGCLMIVALCEEAVEVLSGMNHPDGDCPLCLYPLFPEDTNLTLHPFMKLMSCYHCFHSECIIRWWKWIHDQKNENEVHDQTGIVSFCAATVGSGLQPSLNQQAEDKGNCPVCRKEFDKKDIEHVLHYMSSNPIIQSGGEEDRIEDYEQELLQSKSEEDRRKQFDELLKLQQERNGIIEPKRDLVVQPGMFISLPTPPPTTAATAEEEQEIGVEDSIADSTEPTNEAAAHHNKQKNAIVRRKHRTRGSRKQQQHQRRQWVQKEAGNSSTSDQ
ncbi:hypothetical protein LUZ63_010543 [Rhynchospora breviuscula]|uniref:E3 ubiquitin-protein ligase RNF25 n=1 Tax=Rhynchospora breviuscula TaxID=2022672 RepID=A0A9Q0CHF6_9POAL|nr:hypothetical protein LUZ63_010543 [Rhynchospora breviuscula]